MQKSSGTNNNRRLKEFLPSLMAFGLTAVIFAVAFIVATRYERWRLGDDVFSVPYPVFLFHVMFYGGVSSGAVLGAAIALVLRALMGRKSAGHQE